MKKPKKTVAVIFLYGIDPYILDWEKFPTERLILTHSRPTHNFFFILPFMHWLRCGRKKKAGRKEEKK